MEHRYTVEAKELENTLAALSKDVSRLASARIELDRAQRDFDQAQANVNHEIEVLETAGWTVSDYIKKQIGYSREE